MPSKTNKIFGFHIKSKVTTQAEIKNGIECGDQGDKPSATHHKHPDFFPFSCSIHGEKVQRTKPLSLFPPSHDEPKKRNKKPSRRRDPNPQGHIQQNLFSSINSHPPSQVFLLDENDTQECRNMCTSRRCLLGEEELLDLKKEDDCEGGGIILIIIILLNV